MDDFHVDTSLPSDTAAWDVDVNTKEGQWHVDPWSLHPIYETHEPPLLGITGRPQQTPFKNLLHCGRDVLPGLGVEGEYITGLTAADALTALRKKS
ncbi:MAG: hypothetical protein R3C68_12510 [Myxococcota bacterium]